MSMKMKGLLKGLRYISTIFDEEEEAEMQIGLPTDVKHVAHIGWDGPTASSPSWINQFKEGESGGGGGGGAPPNDDQQNGPGTTDPQVPVHEKKGSAGSDPPLDSPSRRKSSKPKGSKRATSASTSATDSPRKSENKTKNLPPTSEGDSSATATATATTGSKTSTRRKKPKSSSSGGTSSSSKTSNKSKSSTQPNEENSSKGRRMKGKDCQSSALKTSAEQDDQKPLDDISRGIQAM